MAVRHRPQNRAGSIDNFVTIMRLWLGEVRAELAEAISILSSAGLSGSWWADQVRKNLERDDGPAAHIADGFNGDEPATLVEIAFWSGWLKGEKETMERITSVANEIKGAGQKFSAPTLSAFGPMRSESNAEADDATVTRLASEMIGEMEKRSYRPEIEMISISLSAAIDDRDHKSDISTWETRTHLDDFVTNGSTTSLTMLSFNCGLLAGRLIQASRNRTDSRFAVETGREEDDA